MFLFLFLGNKLLRLIILKPKNFRVKIIIFSYLVLQPFEYWSTYTKYNQSVLAGNIFSESCVFVVTSAALHLICHEGTKSVTLQPIIKHLVQYIHLRQLICSFCLWSN